LNLIAQSQEVHKNFRWEGFWVMSLPGIKVLVIGITEIVDVFEVLSVNQVVGRISKRPGSEFNFFAGIIFFLYDPFLIVVKKLFPQIIQGFFIFVNTLDIFFIIKSEEQGITQDPVCIVIGFL
jgi:hypothetical protein